MKKFVFAVTFLITVSLPVSAQGFYFDIGGGVGAAFIGNEVHLLKYEDGTYKYHAKDDSVRVADIVVPDLGFRLGYGPFGTVPVYIVGEFNYLVAGGGIGPGIIFYPTRNIQLGAAVGGSMGFGGSIGLCWNISAAIDVGKRNHGCLIGINYIGTYYGPLMSMLGVFVKYAYREKVPQQTVK
jgi:hypothetical protein